MSISDPIADMLTRIRNAALVHKKEVSMPSSTLKVAIAKVFRDEGYIDSFKVTGDVKKSLTITLRYYKGKPVISQLERASTSGRRVYRSKSELPKVMSGLGVAVISTPKGVMTDKAARNIGQGGEVLCYIS